MKRLVRPPKYRFFKEPGRRSRAQKRLRRNREEGILLRTLSSQCDYPHLADGKLKGGGLRWRLCSEQLPKPMLFVLQQAPSAEDCCEARVWLKRLRELLPNSYNQQRPTYPFFVGKQVGTKNSLPPTYLQGLKISIFHINCFDSIKCKFQFL